MTEPCNATAYMARAIQLAERGRYTTHPNPRVGCVLVKNDQIVGEGWHKHAGEAHAEVNAIADAGAQAVGSTAYVTLEPCCHTGRTGPCTQALIDAGVVHVVAAMTDPNPAVAGQGLAQLEEAGIKTESGLLHSEAEKLNRGFISRMTRQRPWVTLKLASSLDGRTAAADGSSQWITSQAAREDVHRLRAQAGAVLTGIDTVLADNPSLNVRLDDGQQYRQPDRIVLDSRLRMPPDARMLTLPGRTLIMTCEQDEQRHSELQAADAQVIGVAENAGHTDLSEVFAVLAEREINEVLVECGPTLAGAFVTSGLVDELLLYMAPSLIGDRGRGLVATPQMQTLSDRIDLEIKDIRAVGADWRIIARPITASS